MVKRINLANWWLISLLSILAGLSPVAAQPIREVWTGEATGGNIERYDFAANHLGRFTGNSGAIDAMVVVPEPATLGLLLIGGLALLRRSRK